MAEKKDILDEYLETLWHMKERGEDRVQAMRDEMKDGFDATQLSELVERGFAELKDGEKKIYFTKQGEHAASRIIRSHRLAECLIFNVFGRSLEAAACEFEHIITPELVDSICTLLGHPRECPRGMPIPLGECCKHAASVAPSLIVPLTKLKIGEEARVAHINRASDQRLHVLEGLQLHPGSMIQLLQTYPSYVISCEGASIALDEKIAESICLWRSSNHHTPETSNLGAEPGTRRRERRRGFGFGWGRSKGKISTCQMKSHSEE